VLVGRPYLWALAVDGAPGVRSMLGMLRAELELAMGLLGRPTLADLDGSLLA
jgi:4-hydroxymandelate oxidase